MPDYESAKRTVRGNLTLHRWLPLDTVSDSHLQDFRSSELEMLNVNAPAFSTRRQSVSYRTTVNLTRMREITQDLADLFGLRLPISLKK